MALFMRSSATTLATGYVLLGILALVLFALPLGYAWRAADNDVRLQILGEDSQRLAEVFNGDVLNLDVDLVAVTGQKVLDGLILLI